MSLSSPRTHAIHYPDVSDAIVDGCLDTEKLQHRNSVH